MKVVWTDIGYLSSTDVTAINDHRNTEVQNLNTCTFGSLQDPEKVISIICFPIWLLVPPPDLFSFFFFIFTNIFTFLCFLYLVFIFYYLSWNFYNYVYTGFKHWEIFCFFFC